MIHLHVDRVQHLEFQIVETNAMRLPATPSMGSLRLKPSGSFRIGYKARIHICTNDAICDIFKCIYIVVSYIYIYIYFFNFIPHRIQCAPNPHVQWPRPSRPSMAFLPDCFPPAGYVLLTALRLAGRAAIELLPATP